MAAPHLTIAPAARRDLDAIWLRIAEDDPTAADRFLDRLLVTCRKLAAMPGMGPERRDLAAGLRYFPLASYLIFYRPVAGGIQVARVIHGARDVPTALASTP